MLRVGFSAALLLGFGSCAAPSTARLEREIATLRDQLAEKDNQLSAQRLMIDELNRRLATARAISEEDLKKLYYPEKLVIDSLSGGVDTDGKPGDDAIEVYLKPVDRDGDTLKVVGDIHVELFDLAADGKKVGEVKIPADEVGKLWYGKLLTYHYTVRVPWLEGPPAHSEITVRATFVDYLTQRAVSAQSAVSFKPAP